MTDTWQEVILPQFRRSVRYGKVPKIQQTTDSVDISAVFPEKRDFG
jgi:hypothetical protein